MHTAAGRAIRDQRGVAVVLTLFVLLILASLAMAFAMLGASEPQITANHERSAEAMGLAEAGIERVIWGLNTGDLPFPLPADLTTLPAAYKGTDIALGTGVYRVTVTTGATNLEVAVTAEGRIPNWTGYRARRIITATVIGLPNLNPPCVLCVKGALTVKNKTIFDATTSTCGSKQGSYSTGATNITGLDSQTTYGLFGNDATPLIPNQPTDYSQNVPASSFDPFTLTQTQLNLLKDLAKANGTYYQGAMTFSGSVPNGIVFVDTVSGNPIGNPPNPLDFGSLTISGNFGAVKGWIVVMGDLSVSGEWLYAGLLYAANTVTNYHAEGSDNGNSSLNGAMIVQNVSASSSGAAFSTSLYNKTHIQYDCDNIKSAGGIYPPFFIKPGSWRQISG